MKAKWNSAAQGRFVTRAMRAFRKPVARVKIPTKPPNDMRGTTKSAFGHSYFTHFHMLTSKTEGDLTSQAPVLSASNFSAHGPCTCLCPTAPRDILRSLEAVLPWIILIPVTRIFLGQHQVSTRYAMQVLAPAGPLLA